MPHQNSEPELNPERKVVFIVSAKSSVARKFLNGEIFYSLKELRVLAERWRVHYNTVRLHLSLGPNRPPQLRG